MTAITAHTTTATATSTKTRTLLGLVALAQPTWIVVSLAQAATREGFDMTRHPLSALANGDLGWLQITNFVLAGVLTIAGSFGFRRALAGKPGGKWVPRLTLTAGIGLIAAGLLVMDPGGGFPVGHDEMPTTMSWHSAGHMLAGTATFAALSATCFVLGRFYTRTGRRGLAVTSRIAAVGILLGNAWAMSAQPGASVGLAVGVFGAMLWVGYSAFRLR